ncbi:MAG: hypothetical protein SW833_01290 [Cyanobacteriota bacterium]|nr:hypothetical protein [Cyanobacteriota bacterium]
MIAHHAVSRTAIAAIATTLVLNFPLPARGFSLSGDFPPILPVSLSGDFPPILPVSLSGDFPPTLPGGWVEEDISPSEVPTYAAQTILEHAAIDSGLPISLLDITAAQEVYWSSGCLAFGEPGQICTTEVIGGWRAIVASDEQHWIYHSTDDMDRPLIWSSTDTEPGTSQPGYSQSNPILPDFVDNQGWFVFDEVPSGRWFDPPTVSGFQFAAIGDSQFTEVIDFPVGIDSDERFTVSVGNEILGEFGFGQSVDFLALLGGGVSEFTIAGIDSDIDPTSPKAFPVRLAFDDPTASFKMRAVSKSTPEPSFAIALFGLAFLGIQQRKRHKSAQVEDRLHG